MAQTVYRWKGKTYTAETLHEAPATFRKLLEERGVEVPKTGAAKPAASDEGANDSAKDSNT